MSGICSQGGAGRGCPGWAKGRHFARSDLTRSRTRRVELSASGRGRSHHPSALVLVHVVLTTIVHSVELPRTDSHNITEIYDLLSDYASAPCQDGKEPGRDLVVLPRPPSSSTPRPSSTPIHDIDVSDADLPNL